MKNSVESLESSVLSVEKLVNTLSTQVSDLESSNSNLTTSIGSCQKEIDKHELSLKEIYARLEKNEDDLAKQLRSFEHLRKDFDEQINRIDKNERSVMDLKDKQEKHSGILNDHEKRLHELETDIDQAMKAIKSLGGEVQQISKPIEPVIHQVEPQDNSKLDSLYDSIRDLSKQFKELELRLRNNEDSTEKIDSNEKKLEAQVKDLEDSIRSLEDSIKKGVKFDSKPDNRSSGFEDFDNLKNLIKQLQDLLKSKSDDIENLKKQLKSVEDSLKKKANLDELDAIRHSASTGQPIQTDLKALRDLQHRVDELQKLASDSNTRMNEILSRPSDSKALRELQAKNDEFLKLLQSLTMRVDDLDKSVSALQIALNKKIGKPEYDELRKLIGSMEVKGHIKIEEGNDSAKLLSLSRRLVAVEDHLKLLNLPEGYDIIAIFNLTIKIQTDVKDAKDKNDKFMKDFWNKLKELEELLSKKANLDDLRALEELLKNKIKELSDEFLKKFADKIETKRALKYLEKLIRDNETIKVIPEGNDAMLARKPLGGWSCASCQKELERLMGKIAPYQPWNKMPYRDPADRIARAGPGFSRMLATIQPESFTSRTKASGFRNNSPPASHAEDDVVEALTLPPVKKTAERPLTTL